MNTIATIFASIIALFSGLFGFHYSPTDQQGSVIDLATITQPPSSEVNIQLMSTSSLTDNAITVCKEANLFGTLYAEGATGSMLGTVTVTNTGTTTCYLEGYPEIQLFDSNNTNIELKNSKHSTDVVLRVILNPRQKATTYFQWLNECKKVIPAFANILLPGGGEITIKEIETGVPRCDYPEGVSGISVGAFEASE